MEQEAQKIKLEDTSCDSQNAPILCANNCGFFGRADTNHRCSKCYKEFLLNQPKETPIPEKVDGDFQIAQTPLPLHVINQTHETDTSSLVVEGGGTGGATSEEQRPAANRCGFCRKRVGLTGFKCRCGNTFCSQHRYSDKHNCLFDYKSAGQDAVAKANPVVKADKIDKI